MAKKKSPILENAIDSLRVGVRYFLDHPSEYGEKWAILAIFNAAELFLKEGLRRYNPTLIYTNRVETPDGHTVTVTEALKRYEEIGLGIDDEDRETIEELQRRRNRIEHRSFEASDTHQTIAGEALRFIYHFLDEYLSTEMKLYLSVAEYRRARELILAFEERLREAEANVATYVESIDPKERILHTTATCPECGNETLMIDSPNGDYCSFCEDEQCVGACVTCGEYFAPEELEGVGVCSSCLAERFSRW